MMATQLDLIAPTDCDQDAHGVPLLHYYRINLRGQLDPCGQIVIFYDPLTYYMHAGALARLTEAIIVRALRDTASKTKVKKSTALKWIGYRRKPFEGGIFDWAEYDTGAVLAVVKRILHDPKAARKNFVNRLPHNWSA